MNENAPNTIQQIAQNIRTARMAKGMTQSDLARELDLSFQQVQKYETGFNRISADRLMAIAQILSVDIGFFFKGIDTEDPHPNIDATYLRACAELGQIQSDAIRTSVLDLIKKLGRNAAA